MKKVCVMTTVHSCFDSRIYFKECCTLRNAGYDVTLIVTHDKDEVIDDIKIISLPDEAGRFYRIFTKKWICFEKALQTRADIYHLHDPELLDIGFLLALRGKKVIYDVHEDVRKQIMNKTWLGPTYIRFIVSEIYNIAEKILLSDYSLIIAATDTIYKYYPHRKTITVKNFVIKKYIDDAVVKEKDNNIRIIYAGGLTEIRGIKEIIDSVDIVNGRDYKMRFTLLGKWENGQYEKACRQSIGWKYVDYIGNIPMTEVYSYMKSSDIGIATLYPRENYLMSLPIKVFEYMASKIPVIMSDFPYWKHIFSKCAVFVDPTDPDDIAEKIIYLIENIDIAKKLGENGRMLIDETYSWEMEKQKLLEGYKKLFNSRGE